VGDGLMKEVAQQLVSVSWTACVARRHLITVAHFYCAEVGETEFVPLDWYKILW